MQEWSEIAMVLESGDQEGIAGPWEAVWVRRTHTSPPQFLSLLNGGYFSDVTDLVSFKSDHVAEHLEDVFLRVCRTWKSGIFDSVIWTGIDFTSNKYNYFKCEV